MWIRAILKGYAKQELKYSYWLSFAVCLVAGILGGGSGFSYSFDSSSRSYNSFGYDFPNISNASIILAGIVIFLLAFIIVLAFSIFISSPVLVGEKSFFIRAPYGDRKFSNLFSSFSGARYMPIVKTMFFMNLYIFLWSLLLIIPGIIKYYEYRMVPYIISEDPSLEPSRAMELSSRMTYGEKFSMFVLDLSFLGWFWLGFIAFIVGALFVVPYYEATWVQLYFFLRQKVMASPQDTPYQPYMQ